MNCPGAPHQPPNLRRRAGFTLVELLVVITIIGILIALLVPAISGVVRNANEASVISEINALGQALADFKAKYGEYPPSRIIIPANGNYAALRAMTTNPIDPSVFIGTVPPVVGSRPNESIAALAERSERFMRKFFPRGYMTSIPIMTNDTRVLFYLTGDECLVFFLGGIPVNNGGTWELTGFNNNPQQPFLPGGNRSEPFFEFKPNRLVDLDGDGFPSYIDNLGTDSDARPYAYFVSYGNGDYDPNDVNFGPNFVGEAFGVPFSVGGTTSNPVLLESPGPNPYTSSRNVVVNGMALARPAYINPNSFQIISAGLDRFYGFGGPFLSNSSKKFPLFNSNVQELPNESALRVTLEADNLTNFNTSRLD